MTARLFVDRQAVAANLKDGGARPEIIVHVDGVYHRVHGAEWDGPSRMVSSLWPPDGMAKVWVETEASVTLLGGHDGRQ